MAKKYKRGDVIRRKSDHSDRWVILEIQEGGDEYTVQHIRTGAIVDYGIVGVGYELEPPPPPPKRVEPSNRRKVTTIVEREGAPTTVEIRWEEVDRDAGINSTGWRDVSVTTFKEV
jgi:hypothetical protein